MSGTIASTDLRKRVLNIDSRNADRVPEPGASSTLAAYRYRLLNPIKNVVKLRLQTLEVDDVSGNLSLSDAYYFLKLDDFGYVESQHSGTLIRAFARVQQSSGLALSFRDDHVSKDVILKAPKDIGLFTDIRLLDRTGATVDLGVGGYFILTLEVTEVVNANANFHYRASDLA
jgi:hypothetical protein